MHDSFEGTRVETLSRHLAAIRQRYPEAEPEWVAEVVRAVIACVSGQPSSQQIALVAEIEDLGRTIANAKTEIAALRVDDIKDHYIPFATDELGAIVAHTASATNAILEACEGIDTLTQELPPDLSARVTEATTRIYEACSFQDITGQRISKVVSTLTTIEEKVATILATFGPSSNPIATALSKSNPAGLLNGPQLPEDAMAQTEIDRLLGNFD